MLRHVPAKGGPEFPTRERCHITELLNDARSPRLSIARCRVEPGVITELHALRGTEETYLIEAGRGVMDDGEHAGRPVGPGDSILIPAGHAQRIRNTGESDLIFLAICVPRFVPDCYVPLE